jgi:hypothetical protein
MPVDALLGIPDMSNILTKASTKSISKSPLQTRNTYREEFQIYYLYRSRVKDI